MRRLRHRHRVFVLFFGQDGVNSVEQLDALVYEVVLYFRQTVSEIWDLDVNSLIEMVAYRDKREAILSKQHKSGPPAPQAPADPEAETQRTIAMLQQHSAAIAAQHASKHVKVV